MNLDRRTVLRLAGVGSGAALAGCLQSGSGEGGATPTGASGDPPEDPPDTGVDDHETIPFAVRSSAPPWYRVDDGEPVGHAVVVDSRSRGRDALAAYDVPEDVPEERIAEIRAFLEDVEFDGDRLVLLESVGPNGCHDQLEVENVRLEDDRLRADASVLDTGGAGTVCTEALVYPSALLKVTFEGDPVDEVAIDVTDGWDEEATVTAGADDPLPAPDPAALPGRVRPEDDPEPVAPLECDREGEAEAVRRHGQWYDEAAVDWGDVPADDPELSLRVDALEYERGDVARVTLTNVAGESIRTGNRAKYNLQVYTDEGWQDVRVLENGYFEYTDEAVGHAPGEGFEWHLELTESGLLEDAYHDDAEVCPELRPGRYRFAYFGVIGDGAVAVSFDLTETSTPESEGASERREGRTE